MGQLADTHQHRMDTRLVGAPAQGQLCGGEPSLPGHGGQSLGGIEILIGPVALVVHGVVRQTAALGGMALGVLAGEQAAHQGVVDHHAQVVGLGLGDQFLLDAPGQQVIHILGHHGTVPMVFPGAGQQVGNLPGGVVADTDVADFSAADQGVHGFQGLRNGGAVVRLVEVVDVHIVGLQALQALIQGIQNVAAVQTPVVGVVAHGVKDLGGQNHVFPAAHKRLAGDGFAFSVVVKVRGVHKIDALVQGGVDDADAVGLIYLAAEGHGTEARLGNSQTRALQMNIIQRNSFFPKYIRGNYSRKWEICPYPLQKIRKAV